MSIEADAGPSSVAQASRRTAAPRSQPYLLVGAARVVGEPLDLDRAARGRRVRAVRLHDQPRAQAAHAAKRSTQLSPEKQMAARASRHSASSAAALILTTVVVGVFYCLGTLYNERRDRSILFWKSMPVSDLTTVLSKSDAFRSSFCR